MHGEDLLFGVFFAVIIIGYWRCCVNQRTEVQVEVKLSTPWDVEDEPKPQPVKVTVVNKLKKFTSAKEVDRFLDDRRCWQKYRDTTVEYWKRKNDKDAR